MSEFLDLRSGLLGSLKEQFSLFFKILLIDLYEAGLSCRGQAECPRARHWHLLGMPRAVAAFYDHTHEARKPVSWGWLGAWWHCWHSQQTWELPAFPLLVKFSNWTLLFLKFLLAGILLSAAKSISVWCAVLLGSEGVVKTVAFIVYALMDGQICLLLEFSVSIFLLAGGIC